MKVIRVLRDTFYQLLGVPAFNWVVFKVRFLWFFYIKRQIRAHSDEVNVRAPRYSLNMLKKGRTSNRPLHLIRPLSVIDHLSKTARILSIGSRFETELLYLVGHGFSAKNIKGFDMISYSPWIDCGNMHAMPYADNSWDAIILGWVLSYSESPRRAAQEVVRVGRNGAIVAIGVSYYPMDKNTKENLAQGEGKLPARRLQTVAEFLSLFKDNVDVVFFQHDVPDPLREGFCKLVFRLRK